jgi:uncharacterized membrane-anchored protein YjiN (DUF445 family)
MMDRIEQMQKVQAEVLELFKKKNTDYGDSFADYGVVGVLVRMGDKLKRFVSVSNNGVSLVNDEALHDTLIDLHNYAAMALMLMSEKEILPNLIKEDTNLYNKYEADESIDISPNEDLKYPLDKNGLIDPSIDPKDWL